MSVRDSVSSYFELEARGSDLRTELLASNSKYDETESRTLMCHVRACHGSDA